MRRKVADAVHGCQAMPLLRRHVEIGIDHAERFEDPFTQKLAQRPVGDNLDHVRRNVDRHAIMPLRPPMVRQRQASQLRDELFQRPAGIAHERVLAVQLADRRINQKIVGESAEVRHQVADRDRALRRDFFILLQHLDVRKTLE